MKRINKIAIVDIESTCWRNDNEIPKGEKSEIIEIGICLLDTKTGEISDNRGIIIKPVVSNVSEFCTELTKITPEMCDSGISFKEAIDILVKEYKTPNLTWASYGGYDLNKFRSECYDRKVNYPFGPTHINVKNLYAIKMGLRREIGMRGALAGFGLELEGVHHRGIDDVKNIAKILYKILH